MKLEHGSTDVAVPPGGTAEWPPALSPKFVQPIKDPSAMSDAFLTVAHSCYNHGHYHEALATCHNVFALFPRRAENLLLLGACYYQLHCYTESAYYNRLAIDARPTFAEAHPNLANALKELGDVQGALRSYRRALTLKPQFADAYNNMASVLMQQGRLHEAAENYCKALLINPTLVDAHSNLGSLYKAQGCLQEAKQHYHEAIRLKPNFAVAWSNLASIVRDQGETEQAIMLYREAIKCNPHFADAYSNLGNVFKEQGRLREAVDAYQAAIQRRPDFAIAYGNMASALFEMGRVSHAIAMYKHALRLQPVFPDAYNNLGNALKEVGYVDEAISCYRVALRLNPDHTHAYNNLGNALKERGHISEAICCYQAAIRVNANFAVAYSNLASSYKEQGRIHDALAYYREAIRIDPFFADAYSNMGNALKEYGRIDEAIQAYQMAISLKPQFADAHSNLASAFKDTGRVHEAIYEYQQALSIRPEFPDAFCNMVHSLLFISDWTNRASNLAHIKEVARRQLEAQQLPAVQPFHALVYPTLSGEEFKALSRAYAARTVANVAHIAPSINFQLPTRREPGERLRIGYVSSDFGNHPLSHLMQSVFGFHDRSSCEIVCYALSPNDGSEYRRKIEAGAEHFIDVSQMSNDAIAQLINSHKIHILINLNGYTKGARNEIFALRPAPVQMLYMGFPGTTGASYIDYMVIDRMVCPRGLEHLYSERVLCLPHSYFVNDHMQSFPECLSPQPLCQRSDYGIPHDAVVLCNFNQLYKADPDIFNVWSNILRRCPHAILWLLRFPAAAEPNIRREAAARGVNPNQILFTEVAGKIEHIHRGALADLFLDTPVCNGHTTGCDILWAGTPMVTLPLESMASRVGAGLVTALGMHELVMRDHQHYEDFVVDLILNPAKLRALRDKVSRHRTTHPLFNTRLWVRDWEHGLRVAWDVYERGEPPRHIDVNETTDPACCGPPTCSSRPPGCMDPVASG